MASDSSSSSSSSLKAWYEKGIYAAYTFDENTRKANEFELKNMVGNCDVCQVPVKGAFRKSSNFIRHLRVSNTLISPLIADTVVVHSIFVNRTSTNKLSKIF